MGEIGTEIAIDKAHNERSEGSRAEVARYFAKESDIPQALVQKLLDGSPEKINTSILRYQGSDRPKSLKDIASSLVLVHLTDFAPEEGYVLPRYEVTKKGTELPAAYRTTIHSALSYPVVSHGMGYWGEKKLAILVPFERVVNDVGGYNLDDVYTVGPIKIDSGITVKELDRKDEAVEAMLLAGVIDRVTMREIVSELVIKGEDDQSIAKKIIMPNWEVDLDYVRKNLSPDHPLIKYFKELANLRVSRYIESPVHYLVIKEILRMGKLPLLRGVRAEVAPVDVFRGHVSENKIESSWDGSGLDKFLRGRYGGKTGRDYLSHPEARQSHALSVWKDIEDVWELVRGKRDSSFVISKIGQKVVGTPLGKERTLKVLSMIRPGGELWKEVMKYSWRTPKLVIYGQGVLNFMTDELENLIT